MIEPTWTEEGGEKPLQQLDVTSVELPAGTRVRRGAAPIDDPVVTQKIVIHVAEPDPPRSAARCELGHHRWAWLTSGGQACGYCGRRRA